MITLAILTLLVLALWFMVATVNSKSAIFEPLGILYFALTVALSIVVLANG